MERDLSMAREVPHYRLPRSCPSVPGAEVAARFNPAHAIGGDMYDFLSYGPSRACIVLGDVSGKGAPAALYAALVSGLVRSLAPTEPPPAAMLNTLNQSLNQRRLDAQYVVMTCAVWDGQKKTMKDANSGLPRPIYCNKGHPHMIDTARLPP